MRNQPSTITRTLAVLMILPCLYIGWLGLQWGIADRHAHEAAQLLRSWRTPDTFNADQLAKAIDLTTSAIRWAPDNPGYRDQQAELLLLRFRISNDPEDLRAAINHLEHSRSIRPEFAMNWAIYAEAKHLLGEPDANFANAIRQASHFGPWEPVVIQTTVQLGTARYRLLPDDVKPLVIDAIHRAMQHSNARLPSRAAELIKAESQGWTLDFARELIKVMAEEPWQPSAEPAYVDLALTLWPVIPEDQRNIFILKLASAIANSRHNGLVRQVRDAGQLPAICPHLPRTKRFTNFCNDQRIGL